MQTDTVLLLAAGLISIIVTCALLLLVLRRSRNSDGTASRLHVRPVQVDCDNAGVVRRAVRVRGLRNRTAREVQEEEAARERDEHLREVFEDNNVEMPTGKIGTKKLRKLEEKAERRRLRELELQEREERQQKQAEEDERRRKEEQKKEDEEKRKEEEQRKQEEERERHEHEEYLKMKAAFAVEEEGYDEKDDLNSSQKLSEFIAYVNDQKVVQLEDLAARFRLKTQDCIDRIQRLLEDGSLCGVIDDRGKFISITREELEEIARFIKIRGRVSIQELVENSNRLINLAST
ncbi:DDRGK domain-containing protein 1-like [Tropilaelaps mercedesae]|uniref:DDRGK domain-containing protein 1 n=1 Tax=Tropilaelaps mercedesae TaxID=418985 RepID=A0A1V9XHQ2_9ACAR|nr:DDRGK domain-containing protein 1-like [Tropilaelaps mercedesae]